MGKGRLTLEVASFPNGDHDDFCDSMTMALMRFRQGGFVRLDGEEFEDDQTGEEFEDPDDDADFVEEEEEEEVFDPKKKSKKPAPKFK